MPRQTTIQNYNNLSGGIVSDGNDISTVENAVKDALNFRFTANGTFLRKGLDYEDGAVTSTNQTASTLDDELDRGDAVAEFSFVDGIEGLDIAIRQFADRIYIYRKGQGSVLADEYYSFETVWVPGGTEFNSSIWSDTDDEKDEYLKFEKIVGRILMYGRHITPRVLLYDSTLDSFSITTATQDPNGGGFIRDLDGLYDGLDLDEHPLATLWGLSSVTGTFTQGEEVVITSAGTFQNRSFRAVVWYSAISILHVDKTHAPGAGHNNDFDCIPPADGGDDYTGYSITGQSSGATGTINTHTYGVSDAHFYNLCNQGWDYDKYWSYLTNQNGVAPSNDQVWFEGKDSNGNFDPEELLKLDFGSTPAPKGRFIIDFFKRDRSSIALSEARLWGDNPVFDPLDPDYCWDSAASFANRIAFSGAANPHTSGVVCISGVLQSPIDPDITDVQDAHDKLFSFYQRNDPTSEISNELLADDGLTITITGAGTINKMIEANNALLCFSEKGVWAISGPDFQSGFKSDDFSVTRVTSAPGTRSPEAVIATDGIVYYWTDSGIWTIIPRSTGGFEAQNISLNRIQELYDALPVPGKRNARGYFDSHNNQVMWAVCSNSAATSFKHRDKILIFDLLTQNFSVLQIGTTYTEGSRQDPIMYIHGFVQDPILTDSDGKVALKLMMGDISVNPDTCILSIMEFNNEDFIDYRNYLVDVHSQSSDAGQEYTGYIETWPDTLGDFTRKKEAPWIYTYMKKTETGFESDGSGGFLPVNPSSLTMQTRWSWHNTTAGGKLGTPRQIYRHKRTYAPSGLGDDYDTGETVLQVKSKAFGRGFALGLYFESEAQKNAVLLGYAIPYTVDGSP